MPLALVYLSVSKVIAPLACLLQDAGVVRGGDGGRGSAAGRSVAGGGGHALNGFGQFSEPGEGVLQRGEAETGILKEI